MASAPPPPTPAAASSDVTAGRPLSSVELLDDDEDDEEPTQPAVATRGGGGFANGGFELGSPLTPPPATTQDVATLAEVRRLDNASATTTTDDYVGEANSIETNAEHSKNELDSKYEYRNQQNNDVSLDRHRPRSTVSNDTCSIQIYPDYTGANGASIDNAMCYPQPGRHYPMYYGAGRGSGDNFDLMAEEQRCLDNSHRRGCREGRQCNGNVSPEESSTNSSSDSATIAITTAIVHDNREGEGGRSATEARENVVIMREGRRFDRPSWFVDGNSRTQQDENLWRRRRKTDPEGNYSYHRDYQEALSSLLWEPYDCRQPSTSGNLDDADVSLWLYPPGGRPQDASSSASTSSMSSTSSVAVEDAAQWRVRPDASSSSLHPLVTAAAAGALGSEVGNGDDPHRDAGGPGFVDLQGRRFASAPPGAPQSRCSGYPSRPLLYYGDQLQSGGRGGDTMLVNVETVPNDSTSNNNNNVNNIGGVATTTTVVSTDRSSLNSVSVVNCYRAVPVVVSAVPAISCLNTSENVSNVHVVQQAAAPAPGVARTFTSTEAQTDDISGAQEVSASVVGVSGGVGGVNSASNVNNREQRRRERRERRHQRRLNTAQQQHHNNLNHEVMWTTQVGEGGVAAVPSASVERLPDILNSHLPPPYSTLPLGLPPGHMPMGPPPGVPVPNVCPVPMPVPVQATVPVPGSPPPQPGIRFPFQIAPTGRRRSRRTPRGQHYTPEEEPKSCCGVIVTQTVSIRWFIVMIAFVGICCAVVGTVLGAMKASGREHLTVSLLMIGVGIVLITVSGVAWRLTAHDAPSCRVMLGLSRGEEGAAEPNRRFVPRLPPSYGRPHHPYAAMMYPEFQYRPPPPSYQASMQEYRLRLLLLDRHSAPGGGQTTAISPPPTYRSHPGTLRTPLGIRGAGGDPVQDYSRPPSYRSRTGSTRPTLDPNGNAATSPAHSRDPSATESCNGSAVNVISVLGTGVDEPESLDSMKMCPDRELPLRMVLEKGGSQSHGGSTVDVAKDSNLVTIVSTGNDSSPVIVTVSGSTVATTTMCGSTSQQCVDTEMEILAHL